MMLLAATLLAIDPLSLWEHIQNSANPYIFTDDVRQQIWPLFKWQDPALFPDDYIASYYLDAYMPRGYVIFFGAASWVADPQVISKILPYLDYLIVLLAVAVASWKIGKGAACWGSVVLYLGTGVILMDMMGGLPRSFGYPIVSISLLGLVLGRPWLLVLATLVGGAFYYVGSVVSGLALAIYLLLFPKRWRGLDDRWTLRRRVLVVALTGLSAMVLVSPGLLAGAPYGSLIGPERYEEFPEAGLGGRYYHHHGPDTLPGIIHETLSAVSKTLGSENFFALIVILICGLGLFLRRSSPPTLRLLILPVVALIGFQLATWWDPYFFIPARYTHYVGPIFVIVFLPAALLALFSKLPAFGDRPDLVKAISILACVAIVFFTSGLGPSTGLSVRIPTKDIAIYSFIEELPDDAVIAGLPTGMVENVPYLSKKKILYSHETHMVFHEEYILTMRQRLSHLLEALYAKNLAPVILLRDEYHVTHLIIEKDRYSGFKYFKPFDSLTERLTAQARLEPGFIEQARPAIVFQQDPVLVLDLARLGGGGSAAGVSLRPE
jgi:hypothetical protein